MAQTINQSQAQQDQVKSKVKSRIRSEVNQDLMKKEFVSADLKAQCLATTIFHCTKQDTFLGNMLQVLHMSFSHVLPTAGVMFNPDQKKYELLINPYFFCVKLNAEERVAVMLHEIYHLTHKHLTRAPMQKLTPQKRQLMNIAADMSINQYIQNLPCGCPQCKSLPQEQPCPNELCPGRCIDVKNFKYKDKDGKEHQFKTLQTMEFYYEKLLERLEDPDNDGDGQGNSNLDTIDEHMWDNGAEEADMIEAVEDLVKRTMMKTKTDYSNLPGHIKELLDELKGRKSELNYRALILAALKKHAAGHDRKHTWTRKNKRFGFKAPGTKVGELPKLQLYLDTSGSISIEELNEFLAIVDEFLKVGSRKCTLSFFHTEMYGKRPHKRNDKVNKSDIQSGGTDLTHVMEDIVKDKPDMSIIITDGYYGDVKVENMLKPNQSMPHVLWIISKGGTEEHPIKRIGNTVKVPNGHGRS